MKERTYLEFWLIFISKLTTAFEHLNNYHVFFDRKLQQLMKQMFTLLFVITLSAAVKAGGFTGTWTGTFNYMISLEDLRFNARMDFEQNGNFMMGVLYLTRQENGKETGCDYLVYGWINKERLELRRMLILKNKGLTEVDATLFTRADAKFDFSDRQHKIRAAVFMKEENTFGPPGTLKLQQKDTALAHESKELLKKYTALFFPFQVGAPAIMNTDFRTILWRKQLGTKPFFEFISAKGNTHLVKVSLYFNGNLVDQWKANESNTMEVDVSKLEAGMHCFVLKVETPSVENVRFTVRRSAANVVKDLLFDISYQRQVLVIMGLDE